MIDMSYIQEKINMSKRKEILNKHPYKIWEGNDGKWYTYIPNQEKGRILKKRINKENLEEDIINYWKSEQENPIIIEVFEEWNDRRLELKKISKATHLRNKQIFNRHYKEFGNQKIKSVELEDFEEFLEEQIPQYDLTAKAFSNLKTITRGFLKRAKKRKLINFNVEELFQGLDTSDIDFKKIIKEDYEEVFSEEEMPIMIDYIKENPDMMNIGIILMFLTGARIGEVVALKHEDFECNTFKIRRTETRFLDDNGNYINEIKEFPKSQAGVRVAIIPEDYSWVAKKIKSLNPFGEYIFVKNGKRISTQAMRMRLKRLCSKLNIYHKSPHKIRKTYGTILLDNHIDNKLIMGQMGHTDILCTENHYHRNRKSVETKSKILSSIPEFSTNQKSNRTNVRLPF
ncbi:Tyrosine recombinase XerC [Schaedlerella arabinosiphila]|nr:Tyrosine recombinase XerC [Schaedlerella arabinosiphila]